MSNGIESTTGANDDASKKSQHRDPGTRQWDFRDLLILHECKAPQRAPQIIALTGISRSAVDRRLRRLCRKGVLEKVGDVYQTTEAGKRVTAGHGDLHQSTIQFSDIWPFLMKMPSALHFAMGTLILLAVIAKQAGLAPDDMPTICLLGKSGKLKSWLLRVLAKHLGLSLDDCLIQTPQARARSLIARLDGHGKLAGTNPGLAGKLLGLLEFSKAKSEVMEDIATLQQGKSRLVIDGNEVNIHAVIVLESNYFEESEDRFEQTHFDLSQRRRMFTGDFTSVEISDAMKADCIDYLDEIPQGESIPLPEPPVETLPSKARELIRTVVAQCIRPECRDEIDIGRIETLVRAARAIFPDPMVAAQKVLEQMLEAFGSTKVAKESWRATFAAIQLAGRESSPTLDCKSSQQDSFSPRGWESFRSNLIGLGEDPGAIGGKVAALLQVLKMLREKNLSDVEVFSLLDNFPKLLRLNYLLHSLGMEPERALALHGIQQTLADCHCELEQAKTAIAAYHALCGLGLTPEAALDFANTITSHLESGGDGATAAQSLLELAQQNRDVQILGSAQEKQLELLEATKAQLEERVARLMEERHELNNAIDSLTSQCNDQRVVVHDVQQQIAELDQIRAAQQAAVNELQQRENQIRARSLALLVLYRLLFDPAFTIQPEVQKAVENFLWAIRSNGTMGTLEDAYAEIVRVGDATRATMTEPLDEFALLESALAKKKAECHQERQTHASLEKHTADLVKKWHLLRAYEVFLTPKAGQEILRRNLMSEIDRMNGIMIGRLPSQQPQAEIDAIAERIQLLLDGGLGDNIVGEEGAT